MENQILRMVKHQKHTNIVKRVNGNFAPSEIAILGTKCSTIASLVKQVSENLSSFKMAYFDASHAKNVEENTLSEYIFHHDGNLQITTTGHINKFEQRLQFSEYDFVFINGNHYAGSKQIVFLDPEKEASINKRIDQISDIAFFIKLSEDIIPFQSLKDKFSKWEEIPQYELSDIGNITNHIYKLVEETIPNINGLVLIGGKSTRMGADKSQLEYFGKPQKEHVKELLENNNLKTYYSVQNDAGIENEIHDTFLNLGPFGGICSAFQKDPNIAWLVIATDVPFVNDALIKLLLEKRNPAKVATAIKGKRKEFMEPLITIYEPKAYPILLQYLAQGYSCPRKTLINSDVEIVEVDDDLIRNINTPEEFKEAAKEINS